MSADNVFVDMHCIVCTNTRTHHIAFHMFKYKCLVYFASSCAEFCQFAALGNKYKHIKCKTLGVPILMSHVKV